MAVAQVAEVTPAIVKPETPTQEQDYAVIGTRPIRPDGTDKVTGRALYGVDVRLPRSCCMARSCVALTPMPASRAIDTQPRAGLPRREGGGHRGGAAPALGQSDRPGRRGHDQPAVYEQQLSWPATRCYTRGTRWRLWRRPAGISLTRPWPSSRWTMRCYRRSSTAQRGHAARGPSSCTNASCHWRTRNIRPGGLRDEDDPGQGTNLANHFVFEIGDVAQGFREADVIVEREYRHGSRASGLHRAPLRHGTVEYRWPADHLV